MNKNYYILYIVLAVIILVSAYVIIKYSNPYEKLGTYTIQQMEASPSCFNDDDCGPNQFCNQGHCWGFYNSLSMPWNSCRGRDPYYKVGPGLTLENDGSAQLPCNCNKGEDCGCSSYCSCRSTRGPGGVISNQSFPECGNACLNDDECPKGCPQCVKGTCQPPFDPNFKKYKY